MSQMIMNYRNKKTKRYFLSEIKLFCKDETYYDFFFQHWTQYYHKIVSCCCLYVPKSVCSLIFSYLFSHLEHLYLYRNINMNNLSSYLYKLWFNTFLYDHGIREQIYRLEHKLFVRNKCYEWCPEKKKWYERNLYDDRMAPITPSYQKYFQRHIKHLPELIQIHII